MKPPTTIEEYNLQVQAFLEQAKRAQQGQLTPPQELETPQIPLVPRQPAEPVPDLNRELWDLYDVWCACGAEQKVCAAQLASRLGKRP